MSGKIEFYSPNKIHPHKQFQEGGLWYLSKFFVNDIQTAMLYGSICRNCGYPLAVHMGGTTCMSDEMYADIVKHNELEGIRPYKFCNLDKNIKVI